MPPPWPTTGVSDCHGGSRADRLELASRCRGDQLQRVSGHGKRRRRADAGEDRLTAPGWTDTSVTSGPTYYYFVTAVDDGGESLKSSEAQATLGSGLPANLALRYVIFRGYAVVKGAKPEIVVAVTLSNSGQGMTSPIQFTQAQLGQANTTSTLPIKIGALATGHSAVAMLRFPGSLGKKGEQQTLQATLLYGGQPLLIQQTLTLP